jgi:hypothetical protein
MSGSRTGGPEWCVCFPTAQNDTLGVYISFVVRAVLAMVSLAMHMHVLDGIDDSGDGLR